MPHGTRRYATHDSQTIIQNGDCEPDTNSTDRDTPRHTNTADHGSSGDTVCARYADRRPRACGWYRFSSFGPRRSRPFHLGARARENGARLGRACAPPATVGPTFPSRAPDRHDKRAADSPTGFFPLLYARLTRSRPESPVFIQKIYNLLPRPPLSSPRVPSPALPSPPPRYAARKRRTESADEHGRLPPTRTRRRSAV